MLLSALRPAAGGIASCVLQGHHFLAAASLTSAGDLSAHHFPVRFSGHHFL